MLSHRIIETNFAIFYQHHHSSCYELFFNRTRLKDRVRLNGYAPFDIRNSITLCLGDFPFGVDTKGQTRDVLSLHFCLDKLIYFGVRIGVLRTKSRTADNGEHSTCETPFQRKGLL